MVGVADSESGWEGGGTKTHDVLAPVFFWIHHEVTEVIFSFRSKFNQKKIQQFIVSAVYLLAESMCIIRPIFPKKTA